MDDGDARQTMDLLQRAGEGTGGGADGIGMAQTGGRGFGTPGIVRRHRTPPHGGEPGGEAGVDDRRHGDRPTVA
jgi:hypothetical protein